MSECIYDVLYTFLQKNHVAALATIIRAKGSTPREVGAHMLVGSQGLVAGTVGGGGGEQRVLRTARRVLETGIPEVVRINLTAPIHMEAQGLCGGVYWVLVERWQDDDASLEMLARLSRVARTRERLARVVPLPSDASARIPGALVFPSGQVIDPFALLSQWPHVREESLQALSAGASRTMAPVGEVDAPEFFVDVVLPPPRLVILGAGHIAVPLAQMASLHDYYVVVVDDRPHFAVRERFPTAKELITMPLVDFLKELMADETTYLVFVTRSHALDVKGLATIYGRAYPYIGLIGSRRRIRAVRELLREHHGIDLDQWPQVYAPVGLDIGAETPAEIATAILAELTWVRHGGTGRPLREAPRRRRTRQPVVGRVP